MPATFLGIFASWPAFVAIIVSLCYAQAATKPVITRYVMDFKQFRQCEKDGEFVVGMCRGLNWSKRCAPATHYILCRKFDTEHYGITASEAKSQRVEQHTRKTSTKGRGTNKDSSYNVETCKEPNNMFIKGLCLSGNRADCDKALSIVSCQSSLKNPIKMEIRDVCSYNAGQNIQCPEDDGNDGSVWVAIGMCSGEESRKCGDFCTNPSKEKGPMYALRCGKIPPPPPPTPPTPTPTTPPPTNTPPPATPPPPTNTTTTNTITTTPTTTTPPPPPPPTTTTTTTTTTPTNTTNSTTSTTTPTTTPTPLINAEKEATDQVNGLSSEIKNASESSNVGKSEGSIDLGGRNESEGSSALEWRIDSGGRNESGHNRAPFDSIFDPSSTNLGSDAFRTKDEIAELVNELMKKTENSGVSMKGSYHRLVLVLTVVLCFVF